MTFVGNSMLLLIEAVFLPRTFLSSGPDHFFSPAIVILGHFKVGSGTDWMRMGADKQQKADDEKDSTSSGQMSSLANVLGKCRPALLGGKIPSESEYPGIISHSFHALKCKGVRCKF